MSVFFTLVEDFECNTFTYIIEYFYINVLADLFQRHVYFFHHWSWKVWCQVLWSIINCYLKDLQYCSFSSLLMMVVVLQRRSSERILFLLTNVPLRCWQKCWFGDSVKYSGNIYVLQGYIRGVDRESGGAWLSGCHSQTMGTKHTHVHAGKLARAFYFMRSTILEETAKSWKCIFCFKDNLQPH